MTNDDRSSGPFTTLFVCRENIARSRIAEYVTRDRLEQRFGPDAKNQCVVTSAGTSVRGLSDIHPLARRILQDRGVEIPHEDSKQVTVEMIENASLILTATRSERMKIAQISPPSVQRMFTILQFARLCAASDFTNVRTGDHLLGLARRGQSRSHPAPHLDDLSDPRSNGDQFQECVTKITCAVDSILNNLKAP